MGVAAGEPAAWGGFGGAIVDGNARQHDMRGRMGLESPFFDLVFAHPSSCIRRLFLDEYKKGTREDDFVQ